MIRSRVASTPLPRPHPLAIGFALALAFGPEAALAGARHVASARLMPALPLSPAADSAGLLPTRTLPPSIALPPQRAGNRSAVLPPDSIPVTNCDDSGPGSLRDAVASAVSGDTIDLTNTGCSLITLTTGAIGIGQASLTLQGPGLGYLAISGNHASQVLLHTGSGTLSVDGLTILDGEKYQTGAQLTPARGGCISSSGSLSIGDSLVKYCEAKDTSSAYGAKGGALYALSSVTVSYSTVMGNDAYSTASYSRGGAIYTPGLVTLDHSVISGNESKSLAAASRATGGGIEMRNGMLVKYSTIDSNDAAAPNDVSFGGGIYGVGGSMTIENSTISNNSAVDDGGVIMATQEPTTPMLILSSTVSSNSATVHGGVGVFNDTSAKIANSTIAFNATAAQLVTGAGLYLNSSALDLQSTIVSGNTSNGFGDDVRGSGTYVFSGANNLIENPWATVPPDTLTGIDPLLSPLADNGGPTRTNALSLDSPAVDMGNDSASVNYDQRGPGYPRTIGANVDIGAFEAETDRIFANGFD
jgi:hypothetical protein